MKRILAAATITALWLFSSAFFAWGQEARGTLLGRVTDSSGAVIPGASVKITSAATGITASVTTNDQGNYVAPFLIPGLYQVSVQMEGFKRFVRDKIELRVDDRLALNIVLEVGDVTQTLTVVGDTPLLDTASASLGQVVDARRVAELPIAHGNPYQLIQLASGVAFARNMKLDRSYEPTHIVGYAMDGARSNRSEVLLDGVPSTATANANEVIASYVPPADVVGEFRVQPVTFDASVGNTEGGVVNMSLKSGSKDFHGTAYFVKMHPALEANLFFANRAGQPHADFNYNRWGTMASGPVIFPKIYNGRSRTFYMYGYEGIHERRPRGSVLTVPAEQQRAGDFSGLLALGSRYQIYDPATRRAIAGGRFQSNPFPGNIIPPERINAIAKKILAYYDLPNVAGTSDGRNNLDRTNEPEPLIYYTHTFRLDHNISDRHRLFSRVNVYKRDSHYNTWFHTLNGAEKYNITQGQWFQFLSRAAAFDDVYTFTPTLVMNWRASYNRFIRVSDANPESYGFDLTTLGLPAAYNNAIPQSIRRFPQITIGAYAGTYNGMTYRPTDTVSLIGAFDKVQGSHAFKFGMEYRVYLENQRTFDAQMTGRLEFGTNWTRGPLDNAAAAPIGQDLASLLLGLPTGGWVDRRDSYAESSSVWSFYLHDDWKLTRRLTINLGLRYELEGPLTERHNRAIRGFDYAAALPIEAQVLANYAKNPTPEVPPSQFKVRGGITFPAVNGLPRTLWERDRNNLMPRFGFAYTVGKKTVIRGGYGIFFGFLGARRGDIYQNGFSQRTNLVPTTDGGLTFSSTLANPFPNGILEPPRTSQGLMTDVGQSLTFYNVKPVAPYNQKWQLSIQREMPHRVLVDLGYVGNRGTKILTTRNLNGTPLVYLSRSPERDDPNNNYLTTNMPNPFYGVLPGTTSRGSSSLIGRAEFLRAFPHFTSLNVDTNEGYSWYHAFQARVEKRFAAGYTFQAAYTWSKFMEATGFLNDASPRPEEVISDQDYPHRFTVSAIYELPFGRGRRFCATTNRLVSKIVSGWQVQGIYSAQGGQAIGFGNSIYRGNLADIVLPKDQRTPERWFNTAGFETLSGRQLVNNVRTMSTRFSFIRGDGINNWDLSVIKNTRISESKQVQFRGEFLNAFNHVLFANPNTTPTNTAFGTITAEKGYPRRIQLGIKFIY